LNDESRSELASVFYDDLTADYHLVYADWAASVSRQAQALDRVMAAALGVGPKRILDCTCGIGTQALGLASLGHDVVGTDLSVRAVERARREADARGLSIRFEAADIRSLADRFAAEFDVVLSGDNALPHLLSDADLRAGVRGMAAALRPGGLFLASIRDYDRILEDRPTATPVMAIGGEGERRVIFQLWTWAPDGRRYRLELFLLREAADDWTLKRHTASYRAVTRAEVTRVVEEEAHAVGRWWLPEESGFFQPLIAAVKRAHT
jgi:glycine/sarcosine N-methyltransferase